jgi:hypothetical protein
MDLYSISSSIENIALNKKNSKKNCIYSCFNKDVLDLNGVKERAGDAEALCGGSGAFGEIGCDRGEC